MIKHVNSIYNRVSVRDFLEKDISEEMVYNIIKAGTFAPSSGNMQPWEFVIVRDRQQKCQLIRTTFSGFYSKNAKNQFWLLNAPIIIVICVNYKRTASRYGVLSQKWAPIDTANAVQNMILTATENNLRTCWVGGILENEAAKLLNLPNYVMPIGLLPLGYAKEERSQQKYKMNPSWITHKEKYNIPYFKDNIE